MSLSLLIFSRDRALQLEACLRSLLVQTKFEGLDVTVLFTTSDTIHHLQYRLLENVFPQVTFQKEEDFFNDVIRFLESKVFVMFGVDDNIYFKPWSPIQLCDVLVKWQNAIGFSLRLGKNINFSYPFQKDQESPRLRSIDKDIAWYEWNGAPYDFGYPLEVSSTIYRGDIIRNCVGENGDFNNPNQLEDLLCSHSTRLADEFPQLICFNESVVFACPINMVQKSNLRNLHGLKNPLSTKELSERFRVGERLDLCFLDGFIPRSCHQEVEFAFKKVDLVTETRISQSNNLPLVSVIVVCYNYGKYLRESIESVEKQTFSKLELIIVDGGSEDIFTLKILEELSTEGYRVERRRGRHFVGSNRNFGVSLANGEYVCCLDADDVMHPTFVEKTLFHALLGRFDIVSSSCQSFGDFEKIFDVPEYPSMEGILDCNQIHTLALVRRSIWNFIGGMDDDRPDANYIFEDWDFWMRCLLNGAKAYNLNLDHLMLYRKHGTSSLSNQDGNVPNHENQRAFLLSKNKALIDTAKIGKNSQIQKSFQSFDFLGEIQKKQSELILVEELDSESFGIINGYLERIGGWHEMVLLIRKSSMSRKFISSLLKHEGLSVFELERCLGKFSEKEFIEFLSLTRNFEKTKKIQKESVNGQRFCLSKCQLNEIFGDKNQDEKIVSVGIECLYSESLEEGRNDVWLTDLLDPFGNSIMHLQHSTLENAGIDFAVYSLSTSGIVWKAKAGDSWDLRLPVGGMMEFVMHINGGQFLLRYNGKIFKFCLFSESVRTLRIQLLDDKKISVTDEMKRTLPFYPLVEETEEQVKILATGEKSMGSNSNEIWIAAVTDSNGKNLLSRDWLRFMDDKWSVREEEWAPSGFILYGMPNAVLKVKVPKGAVIHFVSHDWSGIVEIHCGSNSRRKIDLFSESRKIERFTV